MQLNLLTILGLSLVTLLSLPTLSSQIYAAQTPNVQQNLKAKINLNKADEATLAKTFKGIGKKRAKAIISYRETHSGIKSIEELAKIRGIGKSFVQKNLAALKASFSVS